MIDRFLKTGWMLGASMGLLLGTGACDGDNPPQVIVFDFEEFDVPTDEYASIDDGIVYADEGVTFTNPENQLYIIDNFGWGLGDCDDAYPSSGDQFLGSNTSGEGSYIEILFDPPVSYVGAKFGVDDGEDGILTVFDAEDSEIDSVSVAPLCPPIDEDSVIEVATSGSLIYRAVFQGDYIVVDDVTIAR